MTLPIVPHKLILPNGRDVLPRVQRRRAVLPSNGDVHLRCNNCGSTDWTLHMRVLELVQGAARITNAVCSICGLVQKFDDIGRTGGSLTITKTKGAAHRESINERPDNT